jgi:hypothetical protein
MKTNKTAVSISTTISATVTEDNRLIISVPLISNPKLTKNGKNYTVANTGDWPNNWVTVDVNGEQVGLTLCAVMKNLQHPDNQPKPVAPAPVVPTFFKKAGNGNGAAKPSRIMPGSCA